jgi:hypothetical protein
VKRATFLLVVLATLLASSCSLEPWTYRPRVRVRGTFASAAVHGRSNDGAVELDGVLHWTATVRGTSSNGITLEGRLR